MLFIRAKHNLQILGVITGQENNTAQPKTDKWFSSPSHFSSFFSLFDCCLSVVLSLDKGDYLENMQVVFCPNKQHSFKPFMCSDLIQNKVILNLDVKEKGKIMFSFIGSC